MARQGIPLLCRSPLPADRLDGAASSIAQLSARANSVIAELVPDAKDKRYDIVIRSGVTEKQLAAAEQGTVGREGKYGEAYLVHQVDGVNYQDQDLDAAW